jgi:hypothetical protein
VETTNLKLSQIFAVGTETSPPQSEDNHRRKELERNVAQIKDAGRRGD